MTVLQRTLLFAWLLGWPAVCRGSANRLLENRLTIAILQPDCSDPGTNSGHWRYLIPEMVGNRLIKVKSLRVLPNSSLDYALRELNLAPQPDKPLRQDQVRKIGELIEARRVVWGDYHQDGNRWTLNVRVMNVASGRISSKCSASSTNWLQVVPDTAKKILAEIGIAADNVGIETPNKISPEALEVMSRARALNEKLGSVAEIETNLKRAIAIDPNSPLTRQAMASLLGAKGDLEGASVEAKLATKLDPESPEAQTLLGEIYFWQGMKHLAREQFEKAKELDPDEPENYIHLSEISGIEGKWDEAIANLEIAGNLAPYDSSIHLELAQAYKYLSKIDKALAELHLAEIYGSEQDFEPLRLLADVYELLNETAKAVEYYERAIKCARSRGLSSPRVEEAKSKLEYERQRLKPQFISAPTLIDLDAQHLLDQRLAAPERRLLPNALACNTQMVGWAEKIVAGSKNEMEKASLLFAALTRPTRPGGWTRTLTAEQAFVEWSNSRAYLTCQDFTVMYVAMARAVGLKAYYVLVTKDYLNKYVNHACAGVILDEGALLVDPAYGWLGVPHREYEFESDLRVAAAFLVQTNDPASERLAFELAPDWAPSFFWVAINRAGRHERKGAREALSKGLKLDSTSPRAFYSEGCVEWAEKDLGPAATHFQLCLAIDPAWSQAHYMLADIYTTEADPKRAREEYRMYLQGETEPEFADQARSALAQINESGTVPK
jgi:tetratricopeptide (TPR) repeat protein